MRIDDLPLSQVDMRLGRMIGYAPRETLLLLEIAWTRGILKERTIAGSFDAIGDQTLAVKS